MSENIEGKAIKKKREAKETMPGFYTAKEAMAKLGLRSSTFYYHVSQGKIPRVDHPIKAEGMYPKKKIDEIAMSVEVFLAINTIEGIETRLASGQKDAEGIVDLLHSFIDSEGNRWKCASVEQYLAWWQKNPMTHFILLKDGRVCGEITTSPYTVAMREGRLSGRKRAWDVQPEDILSFKQGWNEVYVGAEVRQDIPNHQMLSAILIAHFLVHLQTLAKNGIRISRMYAVSAEQKGKEMAKKLGFQETPHEDGDLYEKWQRYMLDLKTSGSHFAEQYRQAWKR